MKKSEMMEEAYPCAFIAKNKQRLKQYDNSVYLNDGDEFMIELFNPTKFRLLARILINGNSIFTDPESGIVLKPGERLYLERYLNEPRKFKFGTYIVDGNNSQVIEAIKNNGDVVVNFFKEKINKINYPTVSTYTIRPSIIRPSILEDPIYTTTTNGGHGFSKKLYKSENRTPNNEEFSKCLSSNFRGIIDYPAQVTSSYSSSTDSNLNYMNATVTSSDNSNLNSSYSSTYGLLNELSAPSHETNPIETGRVEKGSYSNQKFKHVDADFESIISWTSEWKLLPESRKNITSDDLVQYCVVDGRKRRKNEVYCPSCGTKFGETKSELRLGDTVVILEKNAISVIKNISKNDKNEKIYFVPYPGDDRWYTKNKLEFNHHNNNGDSGPSLG